MKNTIKKCKKCGGSGLVESPNPCHGGEVVECPQCKGLGTPIYDEDYDNALPFMEEDMEHDIDED